MLDGLKTHLTLALIAAKTLVVDFMGVTADQVTETASMAATLALVGVAALFRHMGARRELELQKAKDWLESERIRLDRLSAGR